MRAPNQTAIVVDYHQVNAAGSLLPRPSILSSLGWSDIHLELFQQPKFDTAEHQHPMHVIACGLPNSPEQHSTGAGSRWLDGKRQREPRKAGDLYYRELPHNKFGYDEVEQAMSMMWNLDFGQPMEEDIRAALNYLKSCFQVYLSRVGVTGFCLGGGLTFFTACKSSGAVASEGEPLRIAAAAPFYGMVLDEWIDAIPDITVPMYLFFGGIDPFIPLGRIQQIESRFQEFGKEYTLKIYPEANHGFFCHERSFYNHAAAKDSWQKLTQFFRQHLLLEPPLY